MNDDDGTDDVPDPIDLGTIPITDVPDGEDFTKPNADATKTRRRLFGVPSGDRADSPPPRQRKPQRRLPQKKAGQLVQPLTELYVTMGTLLALRDPICANAIVQNAENCARSLDALAQQNDAVRRALYAMLESSAWGGVLAAHAPLIFAIAMHHVPAVQQRMGVMGQDFAQQVEESLRNNEGDAA